MVLLPVAQRNTMVCRTTLSATVCPSTCMALRGSAHECCTGVQVYMRRKRWVLALHAVKRAAAIAGPSSPEAHCMLLRFCHAAQSQQVRRSTPVLAVCVPAALSGFTRDALFCRACTRCQGWYGEAWAQCVRMNGGQECANGSSSCLLQGIKEAQPVVAEVVGDELKGLLRGKTMAQCNEAFLEAHGSASLAHRAAAARMMVLLDPGAKSGAAKMLVKRGGLIGADCPPSRTPNSPRSVSCRGSCGSGRPYLSNPSFCDMIYKRASVSIRYEPLAEPMTGNDSRHLTAVVCCLLQAGAWQRKPYSTARRRRCIGCWRTSWARRRLLQTSKASASRCSGMQHHCFSMLLDSLASLSLGMNERHEGLIERQGRFPGGL